MLDSFGKWLVYVAVIGAMLAIGWKQPLRYRFMSTADIDRIEHPSTPAPTTPTPAERRAAATPVPIPWMFDPNRKTTLDRENYNHSTSGSAYSPRQYYSPTPYPR